MSTQTTTENATLFEIGDHFHAIEELLIEADGEITEPIDRWLTEYEGKEKQKIDAYCYLIRKYEQIAEEASRLAKRGTQYRKKKDRLKERLQCYLQKRGRHKLETSRFSLTVARNGGKRGVALNEGVTPEMLPIELQVQTIKADKRRIRQQLLEGNDQVRMFAHLKERGHHLRIR